MQFTLRYVCPRGQKIPLEFYFKGYAHEVLRAARLLVFPIVHFIYHIQVHNLLDSMMCVVNSKITRAKALVILELLRTSLVV